MLMNFKVRIGRDQCSAVNAMDNKSCVEFIRQQQQQQHETVTASSSSTTDLAFRGRVFNKRLGTVPLRSIDQTRLKYELRPTTKRNHNTKNLTGLNKNITNF